MKNKTKWVEGLLCRDGLSYISFYHGTKKGQIIFMKTRWFDGGYFQFKKGFKASKKPIRWTKTEWLKQYYAKDLPK